MNPITIDYQGLPVKVSHPADFAIHKLIISDKRTKNDKAHKDREQALAVWDMLLDMGEVHILTKAVSGISVKWQKSLKKYWIIFRNQADSNGLKYKL